MPPCTGAPSRTGARGSRGSRSSVNLTLTPTLTPTFTSPRYAGLAKLSYTKLEWADAEMAEFASTLDEVHAVCTDPPDDSLMTAERHQAAKTAELASTLDGVGCAHMAGLTLTLTLQVNCAHMLELDLSYNDFTSDGLEKLGGALRLGALPALRSLSLAHCTAIRQLPEAIGELHELPSSPFSSLQLPSAPIISLQLPSSPFSSLQLPSAPFSSLHLPMCMQVSPASARSRGARLVGKRLTEHDVVAA